MTFTINILGHDDLSGVAKEVYENEVVEKARALVDELKSDGNVTTATVVTNTTGSVNLLS